jgi:hypothetical protein
MSTATGAAAVAAACVRTHGTSTRLRLGVQRAIGLVRVLNFADTADILNREGQTRAHNQPARLCEGCVC